METSKKMQKNVLLVYFFVTFSSLRTNLAIRNTTQAITKKLISAPTKAPQPITIGPMLKVAVCQAPPGMNGVMIGITTLSTNDLTKGKPKNKFLNFR